MTRLPAAPLNKFHSGPPISPLHSLGDSHLDGVPIVCLSHLRWNFVYQRPQHLMTRFAKSHPVLYVEEAVEGEGAMRLETRLEPGNVIVAVPVLPRSHGWSASRCSLEVNRLLERFLRQWEPTADVPPIYWYYTPLALETTGRPRATLVVYDCMDELASFKAASPKLKQLERDLMNIADVVFTGGISLYEAKLRLHHNVHPFPSAVDAKHFGQARHVKSDPTDMEGIPRPRIGFYGVVDERFDTALLKEVASAKKEWQWVVLGPVVKIDRSTLPVANNIHYLEGKSYDQLPSYLGSWDVAMMPFAINEATRYISPTKTPEYLCGGRPVVSTPIVDVVRTYGDRGLVRIADSAAAFVEAVKAALGDSHSPSFMNRADAVTRDLSWDSVQRKMAALLRDCAERLSPRDLELSSMGDAGRPRVGVESMGL